MPPAHLVGPPAPAHPRVQDREHKEEKRRGVHPALKYGPAAAGLYDALATKHAISKGGTEANPIMAPFANNDAALIASKVGSGVLSGLAADALAKKGHKNWAKAVGGLSIAIPLGAGTHNLLQAQALERRGK
jgi:hypothetical protein